MKRCMIVDDSSVIRKVAKRILGGPEMIVIEAVSGVEALSMCEADMPDIIVVDMSLPDMTAEDFIRQALAIDERERPNIVICMTEFDVGSIMRAKRAGARGYILKPFNRPQLLERFREMQIAA
ncbi:response regulator [Mesorhizobium sp. CAU 1732]|uniref:response regulator n=1 Tax=Mesorhizobium sp. CAU 1732 TaxID=3140358 RepID=UPI0032613E2E